MRQQKLMWMSGKMFEVLFANGGAFMTVVVYLVRSVVSCEKHMLTYTLCSAPRDLLALTPELSELQ